MPTPLESETVLLETALKLLEQEGAEAFTMERLAEVTGVSRTSLYRRLGGREAILRQLGAARRLSPDVEKQLDVRVRILTAARQLFLQHQRTDVPLEEIAREAGVGPATLYRYFGDREGLMVAFREFMRPATWLDMLRLEPGGDIQAELTELVERLLERMYAHRELLLLILAERRRSPELMAGLGESPARTGTQLAAWLEARMDAGLLARDDPRRLTDLLLGMILGRAVFAPTLHGHEVVDASAEAIGIVNLFLNGMRPDRREA